MPGSKGTIVRITDAIKKSLPENAPMPAGFKIDAKAEKQAAKEEQPAVEADATPDKENQVIKSDK